MTTSQKKAIAPSQVDNHPQNNNFSSNSTCNRLFQQSGQDSPCPLCGRTKDADCRWNKELVLCHTYIDQDTNHPEYIYRGPKDIWGQHFLKKNSQKSVRPKSRKEFFYPSATGEPLVKVTRTDNGTGQKAIHQAHWDGQKWINKLTSEAKEKIRLYRITDDVNQNAIVQEQPLLLVEGEGKVDLLLSMGVAATCAIGGAGKWKSYGYPNYLEDLEGATIVLCPDQDQLGLKHCLEIEQDFPDSLWLYAFPDSEQWQQLPKNGGLDIADWISDCHLAPEQVLAAIEPRRDLCSEDEVDYKVEEPEVPKKQTIADLLLEISTGFSYFHTPDRKAYADIQVDGVRQTYSVRSKRFKQLLQYELFKRHQKTAGSETLNQVLGVLEAKSNFEGEERETYLRVAEYEGKIYLDLGTADWTAIEISPQGWQVVYDHPIRFRRPDTLLPLPIPQPGGSLADLRHLLNLDDESFILVSAWLLFTLFPKYPHPILILHGEQGSGKSFTARIPKRLVDPGKAPLIPNIADLRNLAISAENRWILTYDNLSGLNANQSDALCRISTGGGFSTRKLYENDEEAVFEFIRPQILTGIDSLATRGDLLERALLVHLPTIPEHERMTEDQLEVKLAQYQPQIQGALLTAVSQTLNHLPLTIPSQLPRMADFAQFAIAAETAMGFPPGSFMRVYLGNRQEGHETVLEAEPVAGAVQRLLDRQNRWKGTVAQLLSELEKLVDERTKRHKSWPGDARMLGRALKRLAPSLRNSGIEMTGNKTNVGQFYRIERTTRSMSPTSPNPQTAQAKDPSSDISDQVDVTADTAVVTSDIEIEPSQPMSRPCTDHVTDETVIQRELWVCSDMSDVGEISNDALSRWVGKTVKKRGKHGWRGVVKSVDISTDSASVLWTGDHDPKFIHLDELDEVV